MGTQLQTQRRQPLPPAPEAMSLREGFIYPLDCGDRSAGAVGGPGPGGVRAGSAPGGAVFLAGLPFLVGVAALWLGRPSSQPCLHDPSLGDCPSPESPAVAARSPDQPAGFPCLRYLLAFLFKQTVIYFLNWSKDLKTEP